MGMGERDDKRGGSGCAIGLVLVFLFLPVLYVLGVGPAVWLDNRYLNGIQFLRAAYRPLLILMERCEPIEIVIDWYIKFWQ